MAEEKQHGTWPTAVPRAPGSAKDGDVDTDVWLPEGDGLARVSLLLSPGAVFAERYRVERVLGSGGSGIVYQVWDRVLERKAALKMLRKGADEKDLIRFRREVAVAQSLTHAGIVRVYDIGRCGDRDYFSMELVGGGSLADRLRDSEPLPIEEARRLFWEVSEALGHLHIHGIIHRDIKPANILIEESSGRFRLGDLGLAKSTCEADLSRTDPVGTPYYIAPEQVLGQVPDARSDIYALGATLYEALTGHKTHVGSSGTEIAIRKTRKAPVPIRSLRSEIPPELALVVEGCLERKPAIRFASTEEVRDAYHSLSNRGAFAVPLSRLRRAMRGRLLLLLGCAVLVGLLAVAWLERSRAVRAEVRGERVVGINLWGGEAWEVETENGKVSTAAWRYSRSSQAITGFFVSVPDSGPGIGLPGRQVIVSPRGETWYDTAAMTQLLGSVSFDPRSEFSGVIAANVMSWATEPPVGTRMLMPVRVINYPWYFTLIGICQPGASPVSPIFHSTGRIHEVGIGRDHKSGTDYLGLWCGNNELLHMSGFALLPAFGDPGWGPPRMVEQADRGNALLSYTLLPLDEIGHRGGSMRALADGGWELCTGDRECELFDRYGTRVRTIQEFPQIEPQQLHAERMEFFMRLSQVDTSRRAGALDVAERSFMELEARPPREQLERAVLLWIGAKIAAERADLDEVVRRTGECEHLWSVSADSTLLRAQSRILAGEHLAARADLDAARMRRGSTADDVRLLQLGSALLSGDHSLATRLAETLIYPYEKVRRQAFLRICEGHPEEALRMLEPWQRYFVCDRIQLLRGLALVQLQRCDEARQALRAEVDRHGWLREECDWIGISADLAGGDPVVSEQALTMLRRAEKRGRTELEVRLLLPWVRLSTAEALIRDGRSTEAVPLLQVLLDEAPPAAVMTRAHQLLAEATTQ